jgi:hypothetical protein
MYPILKYGVSAFIIVLVSELAKRSDRLGAIVASLPLVTVLSLMWLHFEKQSHEKIANHAFYTFWYVLPTLPMFLVFPWLLSRFGFWLAIFFSAGITVVCFLVVAAVARYFGITLT